MTSDVQTAPVSKLALVTGWIIGILPALMLVFSGIMKVMKPPDVIEGFTHLGWGENLALGLAVVEIACALIYLFPYTAVLGAILMTGYLGGAIAAHVRIGEPFYIQATLGVMVWGGLWLRDRRLRELLPLRTTVEQR